MVKKKKLDYLDRGYKQNKPLFFKIWLMNIILLLKRGFIYFKDGNYTQVVLINSVLTVTKRKVFFLLILLC